jgi:hypothetical protein
MTRNLSVAHGWPELRVGDQPAARWARSARRPAASLRPPVGRPTAAAAALGGDTGGAAAGGDAGATLPWGEAALCAGRCGKQAARGAVGAGAADAAATGRADAR